MKRIISLLVILSFLWLGFSVYQLFNASNHFGSAFWNVCLSFFAMLIFSVSRISMIGKTKLSTLIGISAVALLTYSLLAWSDPSLLSSSWNYFIGLFILFIGQALSELFTARISMIHRIGFWIPWFFLSIGIILKTSSPLFFSSSLGLLSIVMVISLFTVNRKASA